MRELYEISENVKALASWFDEAANAQIVADGAKLQVKLSQHEVWCLKRDHGVTAHPVPA